MKTEQEWFCEECGSKLKSQPGFTDTCGFWMCWVCQCENVVNENNSYSADDSFTLDVN